ncbi:hypothetical protein [Bifidobacterium psychraerophilum]|uniref:hypothetical protein n=1 Tax=Bifidobacterium psychraerophilum TaxID=218140 RepID=UPI0039E955AB
MTEKNKQEQPTVNGVPVNDAPVSSNPDIPVKKTKQDGPVSGTPVSTDDVTYDVPPADLER